MLAPAAERARWADPVASDGWVMGLVHTGQEAGP
jgi:hypothetical protein